MKRAGRIAVNIFLIFGNRGPESANVEMRIHRLKRIERPFNALDSPRQGLFPLVEFQQQSNSVISMSRLDRSHVRPPEWLSIRTPGRHRKRETNGDTVRITGDEKAAAKPISEQQRCLACKI